MHDLRAARCGPLVHTSERVVLLPPATRYVLRGPDAARDAAGAAFGVPLSDVACRAHALDERAALWLGPDEWLLIAPQSAAPALAGALDHALTGIPHSLVDVSHRQCGFALQGADAATLLAAGCPLDLDLAAFPAGMCTRTMLAKAEVVLWRTGDASFRLEIWRSFAPYVTLFLAEAGRGNL